MNRSRRFFLVTLAFAVAGTVAAIVDGSISSVAQVDPSVASPFLPLPALPAAPADPSAERVLVAESAASTPFPAPGLAARVDAWAGSSDPHDAMQAYEAVQRCLLAMREDRTPEEVLTAGDDMIEPLFGTERMDRLRARRHHAAQWCGDLRSDQIQGRMAWLKKAAAAGERDAARSFIDEGVDGQGMLGDGASTSAATQEWYAQRDAYIDAGLRRCDPVLTAELGLLARPPTVSMSDAMAFWKERQGCDPTAAPRAALADDPVAVEYLGYMGRGRSLPPVEGATP